MVTRAQEDKAYRVYAEHAAVWEFLIDLGRLVFGYEDEDGTMFNRPGETAALEQAARDFGL